jgi:lysozyme family protein
MALYAEAVQNTEQWEGGYSYNPADSGGETYRGISRKNWPNWVGWTLVDSAKLASGFPKSLDSDLPLQGLIVDFFHQNFWKYDGIRDQAVANKIFDLGVNVGIRHAVILFQRAVQVLDDGIYGPTTEAAINATSSGSLITTVRREAVTYHNEIVSTHPQDAEFLAGWIRRDNS